MNGGLKTNYATAHTYVPTLLIMVEIWVMGDWMGECHQVHTNILQKGLEYSKENFPCNHSYVKDLKNKKVPM